MRLTPFIAQGAALDATQIGGDKELAADLQQRLIEAGLLDPPVDRAFGPVSRWALAEFARRTPGARPGVLDTVLARALAGPVAGVFPFQPGGGLASRVLEAMLSQGHWVCRHPEALNIVYVEGMDRSGQANDDRPNAFNDLRMLVQVRPDGQAHLVGAWECTTEPGAHYTEHPLNPRGAARIALGQHKAWSVGTHGGSEPHEALVQTMDVTVHRDGNRDHQREGDATDTGLFGINQHWGYDQARNNIGKASAGCLVGRSRAEHRQFMALCKSDPRFDASSGYRFMTTVLTAGQVLGA